MSWQTNPVSIALRNFARKAGVTRVIGRFLQGKQYEEAFDEALFKCIRPGDIIWDVGANVGFYTKRFAAATGPKGRVFGFEPFPITYNRLDEEVKNLDNVTLRPLALGAEAGTMLMQAGTDGIGATSRIVSTTTGDAATKIAVETGDRLVDKGSACAPTVIKIDTEGFELEVLSGMSDQLRSPALRCVFVEVHFGILSDRGMTDAPLRIEELLKSSGFVLRWVDPSHIAALRD